MDDGDPPFGPGGADTGETPRDTDLLAEIEGISLTPAEHQRIKDVVNGEEMGHVRGHDRRYLVVGAGGETAATARRDVVYRQLDDRTDPPAVATRLEDFDLTPDDIRLWTRVFDVLCGRATHVVGVLEDFDGGYVWELGLLFAPSYREKVWILKRRYTDEAVERERYANGMAVSHVKLLLTGERCHEWTDLEELRDAVEEVP